MSAFLALCPSASLVSTLCALNVPPPATPSTPLHLYDGSLYVSCLPPLFTCPRSIPSSSPVHVMSFPWLLTRYSLGINFNYVTLRASLIAQW